MAERDENREGGERRSPEGAIFDIAKKAVSTSVKTLLSSDEGLKSVITNIVPKDLKSHIEAQLKDFKGELTNLMSGEFKRFLDRIDIAGEAKKVLTGMKIEIHTEVIFHEKEGGLAPEIKTVKVETPKRPADKKKGK
ncbi:MAG: hypothetical protein FJ088_13460 [Deltaproteobacteria bacterium]|nr:hypothetical protein [Deltaproteobacteria bacterium]